MFDQSYQITHHMTNYMTHIYVICITFHATLIFKYILRRRMPNPPKNCEYHAYHAALRLRDINLRNFNLRILVYRHLKKSLI